MAKRLKKEPPLKVPPGTVDVLVPVPMRLVVKLSNIAKHFMDLQAASQILFPEPTKALLTDPEVVTWLNTMEVLKKVAGKPV